MPLSCVWPVSSRWFEIALKYGQVETAYFSLGRVQIKVDHCYLFIYLFIFLTKSITFGKKKRGFHKALFKLMNFFHVSSSIPQNCFLCWNYGRPLDFCLKILWKLVNFFLFRRKVHKTVFFLFLFVCFFCYVFVFFVFLLFLSMKHCRSLEFCLNFFKCYFPLQSNRTININRLKTTR